MKKLISILTLVLLLASCVKSDTEGQNRTIAENLVSLRTACFGAISNQTQEGVRYIMEIYLASDVDAWKADERSEIYPSKRLEYDSEFFATDPALPQVFEFRIASGSYYILVWADYGDEYYDASSLLNIQARQSDVAANDKKEAFYYCSEVAQSISGSTSVSQITLKHAVAKVTVRTTDIEDLYVDDEAEFPYAEVSQVEFTYGKYYSALNLIGHKLTSEMSERTLTVLNPTVNYANDVADIFTDYAFMPNSESGILNDISFTASLTNGGGSKTFTKENVSMCNNVHTIFIGDALTNNVTVDIVTDTDFHENEVSLSDNAFLVLSLDRSFVFNDEGIYHYNNLSTSDSRVALGAFAVDADTKVAIREMTGVSADDMSFELAADGLSVSAYVNIAINNTPYEKDFGIELRADGAKSSVLYTINQEAGAGVLPTSVDPLRAEAEHNKNIVFGSNHIINVDNATVQAKTGNGDITLNSFTRSDVADADSLYTYTANVDVSFNSTAAIRQFELLCKDAITGLDLSPITIDQKVMGSFEFIGAPTFGPYLGLKNVSYTLTNLESEGLTFTIISAWATVKHESESKEVQVTVNDNELVGSITSNGRIATLKALYYGAEVATLTISQDGFTWVETVSGSPAKVGDYFIESSWKNPGAVTISVVTNRKLRMDSFILSNYSFTNSSNLSFTDSGVQFVYQLKGRSWVDAGQRKTELTIKDFNTNKMDLTPHHYELRQYGGSLNSWK